MQLYLCKYYYLLLPYLLLLSCNNKEKHTAATTAPITAEIGNFKINETTTNELNILMQVKNMTLIDCDAFDFSCFKKLVTREGFYAQQTSYKNPAYTNYQVILPSQDLTAIGNILYLTFYEDKLVQIWVLNYNPNLVDQLTKKFGKPLVKEKKVEQLSALVQTQIWEKDNLKIETGYVLDSNSNIQPFLVAYDKLKTNNSKPLNNK